MGKRSDKGEEGEEKKVGRGNYNSLDIVLYPMSG